MLVDTDVLIWHLRGFPQVTRRLDQLSHLAISAITYLELLSGHAQQGGNAVSSKKPGTTTR